MSEETKKPEDDAVEPDAEVQVEESSAEEEAASPEADLATEVAELKDRLLRAMAETENVRRRAEKDRKDDRAYAITGFARDVLNVADNLRRTLDALPESARGDESVKGFFDGVEVTERELLNMLEKHGIKKVAPEPGEKFDPNLHQAMFEAESAEIEPGKIAHVVQPGYVIRDRLLRPAMVGVAKVPAAAPESGSVDETV